MSRRAVSQATKGSVAVVVAGRCSIAIVVAGRCGCRRPLLVREVHGQMRSDGNGNFWLARKGGVQSGKTFPTVRVDHLLL